MSGTQEIFYEVLHSLDKSDQLSVSQESYEQQLLESWPSSLEKTKKLHRNIDVYRRYLTNYIFEQN